jgi:probable selenium-dependent hydroxylase accessory protein YqeC
MNLTVLNRPSLFEALLPTLGEQPFLLTAIGGGGKTSLLTTLAKEAQTRHIPTLLTTTTHMRATEEAELSGEVSTILQRMEENFLCFCGLPAANGKLKGLPEETFGAVFPHSSLTLVEGDGSRGLPLKIPGTREPVIPPETHRLVLVCGMSAMGKPLQEVCHRWELSGENGEEPVTPKLAAKLLNLGYLSRFALENIILVMNQCDTPKEETLAKELARELGCENYLLTKATES